MSDSFNITFSKEFLTVGEAVEKFAKKYNIEIRDVKGKQKKKNLNAAYRSMCQHIRRGIEEKLDTGEHENDEVIPVSERGKKKNRKYSKAFLEEVINGDTFEKLVYHLDKAKEKEVNEWQKKAKQHAFECMSLLESGELDKHEPPIEPEEPLTFVIEKGKIVSDENFKKHVNKYQKGVEAQEELAFQKKKFEILMDFIFRHCIELHEEELKEDIAFSFLFDDNCQDGNLYRSVMRLQNLENYYTIRHCGEEK